MLNVNNAKMIEELFENYKASVYEESEMTKEQEQALDELEVAVKLRDKGNEYKKYEEIFDKAVAYGRSAEKTGFILGFILGSKIALGLRIGLQFGSEKKLKK